MPSSGDGTGWDETLPQDSDNVADGPQEIRDLRKGVRIRLEKEHEDFDPSSGGGEHLKGSARAYYQTSFPSQRPDAATTLGADDAGRLMVKDTTGALHYWDGTGWQSAKTVDTDQIEDGIITKEKVASGFTAGVYPYAILLDQKTSGTDGGNFTSGDWRTRTIQTEHTDVGGIVSISSNQFTLGAGKYRVKAKAAGYKCDQHQVRLRNITDSTTPAYGTNALSDAADETMTWSEVETVLDINDTKVFELQHRCATTRNTDGFGVAGSFGGAEIYTVVEIYKLL